MTDTQPPNQALIDSVAALLWDYLPPFASIAWQRKAKGGPYNRQSLAACTLRLVDEAYPERAAAGELLAAMKQIAQLQGEKCENASAEMLFALLDMKVGIARAAIALARPPTQPAENLSP